MEAKLPAEDLKALKRVQTEAQEHGIPLMVVGAGARLLRLDWTFELVSPRTTRDWDVAIEVPDIETWERFRRAVSDPGTRLDAGSVRAVVAGVSVDVLPFGAVEDGAGVVRWAEMELDVVGLADARSHASPLSLGAGLSLDVPTIPTLAAMKVVAFDGRGRRDAKDLRDLHFIAGVYERCGNEDRIFDELGDALASGELCFEHAGAHLLGRDIARQVIPRTATRVAAVLERVIAEHEAWAHRLFGAPLDEAAEVARNEQMREMLSALRDGLRQG